MCGGNVLPPAVKAKRRNSEKRKEKSRDAARSRRSKESNYFQELSELIPLTDANKLDKTSVMRVSVAFMKLQQMFELLIERHGTTEEATSLDSLYAELIEGFLLVMTDEGNMIFLSESVYNCLGIPQAEMVGQSIFDFTHPGDYEEIREMLTDKGDEKVSVPEMSFFIRMKAIVRSKGQTVNLKSSSYKLIHCNGRRFQSIAKKNCYPEFYLITIAEPVPHPIDSGNPLGKFLFQSKHSPDMKFLEVEEIVKEYLGYSTSDLLGTSVLSYYHGADAYALKECFKTLFTKGQCETGYYRFLAKYGGHVWLLTQATVIYSKSTKAEYVICLNHVLSKIENAGQVDSIVQVTEEADGTTKEAPAEEKLLTFKVVKPVIVVSSTKSIFAPKQEVMNKSYLSFPDADLLFQDSIKDPKSSLELDFFGDIPCSKNYDLNDDSFINYRDDSSGYCGTQSSSSGSPDRFSTTPSTPESDCLSDLPNLEPLDEFDNIDLQLSMSPLDKECDKYEDVNFETRAPYIPMNMDDDFPLISPSSSVMWGPQEPAPKKAPEESPPHTITEQHQLHASKSKTTNDVVLKSSLAALLQSNVRKPVNRHERSKSSAHRDTASQKKWHGSLPSESNHRHSSASKVSNTIGTQKHFSASRNGSGNGGNGQIIMLDTLPCKKQSPPNKSANYHRKNGHGGSATVANNHSHTPAVVGMRTTTVKFGDKLVVRVPESSVKSVELKQNTASLPEASSKRLSPSLSGPLESPKRLKVHGGGLPASLPASNSVLLNLLISGEDASHGYLSSGNSKYSESQLSIEPQQLSLPDPPKNNNENLQEETELLTSESELLESLLNMTQYDTEVNAPIQSSHLLQGEDLLDALDLPPSLRDVPMLV